MNGIIKPSDFSADFIVVGSGLGGLCAAAYLARENYRVIVLEKNADIGGKCATRTINGHRYAIGANTFGRRTALLLRDLNIKIDWIPAPLRLYGKHGFLSFPISFSAVSELKKFHMNFASFLKTCGRYGHLMLRPPDAIKIYRELVDRIVKEPEAKELLFIEAWFFGAHPDWLPATALKLFLGPYYGYHKPIYPAKGAHTIPDTLAEYVKSHGGEVLTGHRVTEIGIESNAVHGVCVNNQWMTANRGVISNAEIGRTLAMLTSDREIPFIQKLDSDSKKAFSFAFLLLTIDASRAPVVIKSPNRLSETNATILTRPICEVIDELDSGQINESPVCNLILSDLKAQLIKNPKLPHLPLHVTILWPKKSPKDINLKALTLSILSEIDRRYPNFSESIISSQWLTPEEYEQRFGFSSNPAPLLETPTFTKHSWNLPFGGMYNVGTTVLPAGSHAGCAMESGRRCAMDILTNLTRKKNSPSSHRYQGSKS